MQECGRELPGKCPAYCSALQASLYPVNSESICLSINGIYVANVGGAEPLKRSMGMESAGLVGGHAVSMICFIYTAHFGTWQLL